MACVACSLLPKPGWKLVKPTPLPWRSCPWLSWWLAPLVACLPFPLGQRDLRAWGLTWDEAKSFRMQKAVKSPRTDAKGLSAIDSKGWLGLADTAQLSWELEGFRAAPEMEWHQESGVTVLRQPGITD